jgi:hypothetical protein
MVPDGKKLFSSSISLQELRKDSINKSYTVPTWTMENQGLRMNMINSASPILSLSQIRA